MPTAIRAADRLWSAALPAMSDLLALPAVWRRATHTTVNRKPRAPWLPVTPWARIVGDPHFAFR